MSGSTVENDKAVAQVPLFYHSTVKIYKVVSQVVLLPIVYILLHKEQGSRSARLSPQSMIHYARKLFI